MRSKKALNDLPLAILGFLSGLSLFKAVEVKNLHLITVSSVLVLFSILAVHLSQIKERRD